jgi:hypothetical protein
MSPTGGLNWGAALLRLSRPNLVLFAAQVGGGRLSEREGASLFAQTMNRIQRLHSHIGPAPTAKCETGRLPSSSVHLEFFFDASSPWTYLAYSRIREIARATGVNLGGYG